MTTSDAELLKWCEVVLTNGYTDFPWPSGPIARALKEKLTPAPEPVPPLDEIAGLRLDIARQIEKKVLAAMVYQSASRLPSPPWFDECVELLRILRSRTFGVDKEALAEWFRSRISPPFATPETLAQEGFLERFNARADKRANEEAQALIDSGLLGGSIGNAP